MQNDRSFVRLSGPVQSGRPIVRSVTDVDRQENCFDALRLFAAASVVVPHSLAYMGGSVLWYEFGDRTWFGGGVPMFFVISGYLVYGSLLRSRTLGRPLSDYALNRLLRIAPALIVWAAAVAVLWLATGFYASNGSLWTVPVETSFYVVLPLVLVLTARFGWPRTAVFLITVALLGVGIAALYNATPAAPLLLLLYTFLPWSAFFVVGMLWFHYEDHIPLRLSWAVAALILYLALHQANPFGLDGRVTGQILGLMPLSYLTMFVAFRGPRFLRSPLRFGDLSYGTYIWHMFVVNTVLHFGWGWPAWTILPASLVLAALSWWLVEQPSLGLKRYSSNRRRHLARDQSASPGVASSNGS